MDTVIQIHLSKQILNSEIDTIVSLKIKAKNFRLLQREKGEKVLLTPEAETQREGNKFHSTWAKKIYRNISLLSSLTSNGCWPVLARL